MTGCENWESAISSYLDGELTSSETRELQDHLEGCPSCRNTLALYQRLFGYEEPVAVPQGFTKSVMGAVTLVKAPQRAKKRAPVIRFLAVAAACLLVAVTAIPLMQALRPAGADSAQKSVAFNTTATLGSAASGSSAGGDAAADFALYDMEAAEEAAPEAEEGVMQMMLMAAPTEDAAQEPAENAMGSLKAAESDSGSSEAQARLAASDIEPVSFLVFGPTLPEALAELDFEDQGEGMLFIARIDAAFAALLLEEGELETEPSEDGLFHVLWYPQG